MDAHNTVDTLNNGHVVVIFVPYREVSTMYYIWDTKACPLFRGYF